MISEVVDRLHEVVVVGGQLELRYAQRCGDIAHKGLDVQSQAYGP